eukprot:scaffold13676_cov138-Isochrysis_galbana.AAC.7
MYPSIHATPGFCRTYEASRIFCSGGVPQADVLVCPEAVSRREYSEGGSLARGGRADSRTLRLEGLEAFVSSSL